MAVLVQAGSRSLRASWWNGGSEEIGGVPPTGARSSGGRKLLITIAREEKRSVSYAIEATSSYRVGSHTPPNRSVCATGQRCRRSSWIGNGSAAHAGSACEKSVAQSETGPVMTSLKVPVCCSSRSSRSSWLKRLSVVMSGLLENDDRRLGAVGGGQARPLLLAGRNETVAENLAVALVVRAE